MKKLIVKLMMAVLTVSSTVFAQNLIVNPNPVPGNVSGYSHSVNVPGPTPWKGAELVVDTNGVITVDNTQSEGVKAASFKIDLQPLEAGKTYAVSFEASAIEKSGGVLGVPGANPSGKTDAKGNPSPLTKWQNFPKKWKSIRMVFTYEPGLNGDAISLFMPARMAGAKFQIRNCKVELVDAAALAAQPTEQKPVPVVGNLFPNGDLVAGEVGYSIWYKGGPKASPLFNKAKVFNFSEDHFTVDITQAKPLAGGVLFFVELVPEDMEDGAKYQLSWESKTQGGVQTYMILLPGVVDKHKFLADDGNKAFSGKIYGKWKTVKKNFTFDASKKGTNGLQISFLVSGLTGPVDFRNFVLVKK